MTHEESWARFDEVIRHLVDPPLHETRNKLEKVENTLGERMDDVTGMVQDLDDNARRAQEKIDQAVASLNKTSEAVETAAGVTTTRIGEIADSLRVLRGSIDTLAEDCASRSGAISARVEFLQRIVWALCAAVCALVVLVGLR